MDPPKGRRYKPGESPQRAPASEVARDSRTKTPQKREERCPSLPPKHADAQGRMTLPKGRGPHPLSGLPHKHSHNLHQCSAALNRQAPCAPPARAPIHESPKRVRNPDLAATCTRPQIFRAGTRMKSLGPNASVSTLQALPRCSRPQSAGPQAPAELCY